MATELRNVLAGVGAKRGSNRNPLSGAALASSRYVPSMQAQMKAIIKSYAAIIANIENVVPDIMAEALEPTLDLAKKYCPKDTHRLVNSGYIEKRPAAKGSLNVVIGFAKGGDPDYAVLVHERVDIYHKPPTRSKFLEAALLEDMANVYVRIVKGCQI